MAFPFVAVALFLVSTAVSILLKPRIKRPKAQGFEGPKAQEGIPIPLVYGTQLVGPNIVWWGDTDANEHSDGRGTFYFANMLMTLCHGPAVALMDIVVGGKSLRMEPITRKQSDSGTATHVLEPEFPLTLSETAATTFQVSARQVFGGAMQGGGLEGEVRVYGGGLSQPVDALTTHSVADLTDAPATSRPGVVYAAFGSPPGDDPIAAPRFYWGTSPVPPDLLFLVKCIPDALGLGAIGDDANPAEIIYDLYTSALRGMGSDPDLLNTDAFIAFGEQCAVEGLGLSCNFATQDEAEDMIDDVLKHCVGVRWEDPVTGLVNIELVRPLTGTETITAVSTVLDGEHYANCRDLRIERPSWAETTNDLTLTYRKIETSTPGPVVGEVLGTILPTAPFAGQVQQFQTDQRPYEDLVVYADGVELTLGTHYFETLPSLGLITVLITGPAAAPVMFGSVITADYTVPSSTFLGVVDTVARAQDLASIQQSGLRSQALDFQFFTKEINAATHVARLLNQLSRPLLRARWVMDRTGYALRPGSIVRLTAPEFELDGFQMRVSEVDYGLLEDGGITVSAIEDVFAETVTPSFPPEPPPAPPQGTCPAIAIGYAATSAIRVCLYPSDTNFTIKLWRHTSDLGQGVTTGATVVSSTILGTATSYDDAQTPPDVRYYAAQLIRTGWTDGPLTPWQAMTASAGTPGSCTCAATTWTDLLTENPTTGTWLLDNLSDPQHRLISVETKTQTGSAPETAYAEDATAPYTVSVTIPAGQTSRITRRVTYLDCAGDEVESIKSFDFPLPITASPDPVLVDHDAPEFVYTKSGSQVFVRA